ncbi:flagellar basal body-associated FliL family protein [Paenibacillus koleovorans]|uniref:flagellar basal body-associated FliL family protein n=1 Tax=Paenibacillus koleovorans TaxID=121608 RepID=UPI000FD7A979|nr:flagellar basal body-associated FliL family protein [Paenibacillus koleovorans]
MLKSRMLQWLIMILISITLITMAGFFLWNYLDEKSQPEDPSVAAAASVDGVKPKKLTADQMLEQTVEIADITTNLIGKDFVKISFAFELDSKKSKEEFEKLNTRVKAIIIQTLADLNAEQIRGSKGYDLISTSLLNKINPILTAGKLRQVDITSINIVLN